MTEGIYICPVCESVIVTGDEPSCPKCEARQDAAALPDDAEDWTDALYLMGEQA